MYVWDVFYLFILLDLCFSAVAVLEAIHLLYCCYFFFLKSLASVQLAFNAGEASQMRVEMSSRT